MTARGEAELSELALERVALDPERPGRFSSNYFHDTWHILARTDGAVLLGRLLWGLAFQRRPGTVFLIDAPHLVPTPFEADPRREILDRDAGPLATDDERWTIYGRKDQAAGRLRAARDRSAR